MDLGERIRRAIVGSGKTDKDIASAVGVSLQAVGQWRNGRIKNLRMENLYAFSEATGFSPRWIATGKGAERETEGRLLIVDLHGALCAEQQRELENFARYLATKNASRPPRQANG